jgi:hypothetical protein
MPRDEARKPGSPEDEHEADKALREAEEKRRKAKPEDPLHPNPPYTTKHGITAPKFGSAGSGGAENEPGPERD